MATSLSAQGPELFQREYTISTSNQQSELPNLKSQSVRRVSDGFIYLGAVGDIDDTGQQLTPGNNGIGFQDLIVFKTDLTGTVQWSKGFGTSRPDLPRHLLIDQEENILVVAYSYAGSAEEFEAYHPNDASLFIKLDQSGAVLWKSRIEGFSALDAVLKEQIIGPSRYMVVGRSLNGGIEGGIVQLNASTGDIYLGTGSQFAQKIYGGDDESITRVDLYSIAELPGKNGHMVVGMVFIDEFQTGLSTPFHLLLKLDNNMTIIDQAKIGVPGFGWQESEEWLCMKPSQIIGTDDGNFLVSGTNMITYKIDPNLNVIWSTQYSPFTLTNTEDLDGGFQCTRFEVADIVEDNFGYNLLGHLLLVENNGFPKVPVVTNQMFIMKISKDVVGSSPGGTPLEARQLKWLSDDYVMDISPLADMDISTARDRFYIPAHKVSRNQSSQVSLPQDDDIFSIISVSPYFENGCPGEDISSAEVRLDLNTTEVTIAGKEAFSTNQNIPESDITIESGDLCETDCQPAPLVSISGGPVGCNGSLTLTASVSASTAYEAIWSNGTRGNQITVTESGLYSFVVVDDNGCTGAAFVDGVVNNLGIDLSFISDVEPCYNDCNGTVQLEAENAMGFINWTLAAGWTTFGQFAANNALCAGTYTVLVNDDFCNDSYTFTIDEPDPVIVTTTSTCASTGNNGTITVTVTGGTPPYSIIVDDPWQQQTYAGNSPLVITGLSPNCYPFLSVTDAVGCSHWNDIPVCIPVSPGPCKTGPEGELLEEQTVASDFSVFPNPAGAVNATISYTLEQDANVFVAVRDLQGRTIRVLADNRQEEGAYQLELNVSDLAAGTYLVSLEVGNTSTVQKLTVQH